MLDDIWDLSKEEAEKLEEKNAFDGNADMLYRAQLVILDVLLSLDSYHEQLQVLRHCLAMTFTWHCEDLCAAYNGPDECWQDPINEAWQEQVEAMSEDIRAIIRLDWGWEENV